MKRTNHLTTLLVIALIAIGSVGQVSAQFPPMNMSGMVNQNIAFDQMMNQQAINYANQWYDDVQAYRARTGYTGPINSGFNASTLSAANAANSAAFDSYCQGWNNNQQIIDQTMTNYSQAYRGHSNYTGSQDYVHELPYGYDYYQDAGGYVYQAQPGTWVNPGYYTPMTPNY